MVVDAGLGPLGNRVWIAAAVYDRHAIALFDEGLGELIDVDVLPAGVGQARYDVPFVHAMVGDLQNVPPIVVAEELGLRAHVVFSV